MKGPARRPLLDRIAERVDVSGDCWEWIGARSNGYGQTTLGGHQGPRQNAHRALYELVVEPIPKGLDLDHLCRNRGCVNPDHMEPVTRRENLLRGDTIPARHAAATHCSKGHPWSEENTTIGGRGHRLCRTCQREYDKRRRPRRLERFTQGRLV